MRAMKSPWVPASIVLLALGAIAWVRLLLDLDGQTAFLATIAIAISAGLLLLLWTVALSGLTGRARLGTLAGAILAALLLWGLVRIDGVSGNLVPILRWRFSAKADMTLDREALERPRLAGSTSAPSKVAWLDYPQFLGPGRDATVRGVKLFTNWARTSPLQLWRVKIGAGWSAFAVAGAAAFTQEQRGPLEMVTCYALLTGDIIWSHQDRTRYETTIAGIGPRATPTVDGDRVYALGATGILNCLDRDTGRQHWTRDIIEENGSRVKQWGMSGSPLVHGDLVIVSAGNKEGRSLVAYHKLTGEPAWHGGTDGAGYSSPRPAVLAGVPQILILNHASVAAHDPADGKVLWEEPWAGDNPTAADPLLMAGNRVMVSSGYGVGCAVFQIERTPEGGLRSRAVWRAKSLKAKFSNFVQRDGFVYGLDDGILACVDVATGERRWKGGRYGHGQMILVEDLLLVSTEDGEVALVQAAPAAHRELSRFRALDGKSWNSPALAAPYLLVRNAEEAACYELPLVDPEDESRAR
jgi:outer membrane protein assembly factor BamB